MIEKNYIFLIFTYVLMLMYQTQSFAEQNNKSEINSVKHVQTSSALLLDFLTNTKSLKADFIHEQTNSKGKLITFRGNMIFRRPNRLRWEVKKPYSQLQLLRGKEFLIFDPDLNQVTVREIDDSFVDTPAGLLFSSGPDAKKILQDRYELISAPEKDDLRWVLARPKNLSNDNPALELGVNSNGYLTQLVSVDIFGRSSRIKLKNISWNKTIKDANFVPIIPSGADYVKQ